MMHAKGMKWPALAVPLLTALFAFVAVAAASISVAEWKESLLASEPQEEVPPPSLQKRKQPLLWWLTVQRALGKGRAAAVPGQLRGAGSTRPVRGRRSLRVPGPVGRAGLLHLYPLSTLSQPPCVRCVLHGR